MTDPSDRFCFHAIFAIEALKALEDGCPEDDTEFAGEMNVSIGLRQMLELAVDSYMFPLNLLSLRITAQAAFQHYRQTAAAAGEDIPNAD